jgi:hypothetical protein
MAQLVYQAIKSAASTDGGAPDGAIDASTMGAAGAGGTTTGREALAV